MLINGPTFIARFLQHVLPPGFKHIRHYGLLSLARKTQRMAAARAALAMPAPNAQAQEDAAAFLKRVAGIDVACCPHCRIGRWLTVDVLPANPLVADQTLTCSAGGRRDPPPRRHCHACHRSQPTPPGLRSPRAAELPASTPPMACPAPPPTTVGTAALSASLSTPHDSTSKPAQIGRLNLTFHNSQTCPHRAAVQSNEVYLTPPASVRLTSFGGASDKRFSLIEGATLNSFGIGLNG